MIHDTKKGVASDNIKSILLMASWYEHGTNGFEEDNKKARELRNKGTGLRMKKDAESGNTKAMNLLGCYYVDGSCGFPKDDKLAWKWFKKSADLKNPDGMCLASIYLINGYGTAKNEKYGIALLSMAAAMGSCGACYYMGKCYLKGLCDFPKDKIEAKYWLGKCVESDANSAYENDVKKLLEEIQSENPLLESE